MVFGLIPVRGSRLFGGEVVHVKQAVLHIYDPALPQAITYLGALFFSLDLPASEQRMHDSVHMPHHLS